MGKAEAVTEAVVVFKEIFDGFSDFFVSSVPDKFFDFMDQSAFLTTSFLGITSSGEFVDKTKLIAEAIMNLTNIVIWGIVLFYGFKSLFAYFLSKKVDVPWKFFIRMIICGVLANASFFICYTGVFIVENCTEYIRSYSEEGNISFSCLEKYIDDYDAEEDGEDLYTLDRIVSNFIYLGSFFVAVCLGGRYICIKVLILLSPIFFLFGGLKSGERIFYKWCKSFFILLFVQIILCGILGVGNLSNTGDDIVSGILVCAILLVVCKNIFSFLKLCR